MENIKNGLWVNCANQLRYRPKNVWKRL